MDRQQPLYEAWRRIADNEEDGPPIIRMDREVLKALLDMIPARSTEDLLDDLDDRIDQGITTLESMACYVDCAPLMHSLNEGLRLRSKAEGLHTVRDWLRSYR